jgi:23S rRNA (uracil1939-C5)-methyltransferase
MSYGPHGVGRLDGKVIFARQVAVGDEVDVEIVEDHGSYAYASVERVVRASADHRTPPCPYLPRCGGCPWQHLSYSAQLAAKHQSVRDHLERIGRFRDVVVDPIVPSPEELGYRSRLSLRTDGTDAGFYAAASHDLVPVESCLLANATVNSVLPAAAALVRLLQGRLRRIEVAGDADEDRCVLIGEIEGQAVAADTLPIETFLRAQSPTVRGVVLRGKRWSRSWGECVLTVHPAAGESLRVHAGAFTQVNPAANRLLVQTVLALCQLTGRERVMELYAGAGNFSLPLARRCASLIAVEQNALASSDAKRNARMAGLANLEVVSDASHHALRRVVDRGERFDVVVLDPPRSGARECMEGVLALRPPVLIYVSCNPATLARDLRMIAGAYRIDRVQPIDLFPQTYHVETVVRAVLTCHGGAPI